MNIKRNPFCEENNERNHYSFPHGERNLQWTRNEANPFNSRSFDDRPRGSSPPWNNERSSFQSRNQPGWDRRERDDFSWGQGNTPRDPPFPQRNFVDYNREDDRFSFQNQSCPSESHQQGRNFGAQPEWESMPKANEDEDWYRNKYKGGIPNQQGDSFTNRQGPSWSQDRSTSDIGLNYDLQKPVFMGKSIQKSSWCFTVKKISAFF